MAKSSDAKQKPVEVNPYHFWAARFWHGMLFGSWIACWRANRFRIHLTRWPLASTITCATVFNSLFRPVQNYFYGSYVDRTQIKDAPIFIIGHWRSGTTLLHELLVLDGALRLSHDL